LQSRPNMVVDNIKCNG